MFDVLALLNHTVLHLPEDSFLTQVTHGGTTATGNFNVTAALATVTFFDDHHRRRPRPRLRQALEEHGAAPGCRWPIYFMLIPIEIMGMFVRPFALTMRLRPT